MITLTVRKLASLIVTLQLALISAIQGVKDAAIDLEKVDKNRVGVIYGVGIGGIKTSRMK